MASLACACGSAKWLVAGRDWPFIKSHWLPMTGFHTWIFLISRRKLLEVTYLRQRIIPFLTSHTFNFTIASGDALMVIDRQWWCANSLILYSLSMNHWAMVHKLDLVASFSYLFIHIGIIQDNLKASHWEPLTFDKGSVVERLINLQIQKHVPRWPC